jgi:hypothetical protein
MTSKPRNIKNIVLVIPSVWTQDQIDEYRKATTGTVNVGTLEYIAGPVDEPIYAFRDELP